MDTVQASEVWGMTLVKLKENVPWDAFLTQEHPQ